MAVPPDALIADQAGRPVVARAGEDDADRRAGVRARRRAHAPRRSRGGARARAARARRTCPSSTRGGCRARRRRRDPRRSSSRSAGRADGQPARERRISGSTLVPSGATCSTTRTGQLRVAGRPRTKPISASTPPAEAPTTTTRSGSPPRALLSTSSAYASGPSRGTRASAWPRRDEQRRRPGAARATRPPARAGARARAA